MFPHPYTEKDAGFWVNYNLNIEIKHFGQSDKRILKDDFNLAVILGKEEESNRELTRYEFVPYVSESILDCYLSQEEQENAE